MNRWVGRSLFGIPLGLLLASFLYAYDNIQLKQTLLAPSNPQTFLPTGIAVDRIGRLWVTDPQNNCLWVYTSSGTFQQRIGHAGVQPGEFNQPHGITTDSEGLIYVADTGNNRVQVLNPDGQPRLSFGERGNGPGQLREPGGIAVSPDGVVAIGDRGNQRIQLFSKSGIFLHSIETGSEMDDVAIDVAGRIYVINTKAKQIDLWSPAGQLLRSLSGAEPGRKAFAKPTGVAVNASGLVYVTDRGNNQVREMEPSGHTGGVLGRTGSKDGEFKTIAGVTVSGDTVYIADPGNHRVVVFGMTRQTPAPPLTPVPAVRVQVALKSLWPVDADNLAVDVDGRLLTLSKITGLLTILDREGKPAGEPINLKQSLTLKNPVAITADPTGNIYLADAGANRIVKADLKGGKLGEFGQKNSMFKGGEGEIARPEGITYARQNVLVADTANSRFQVFNDQGLFMFAAGEKGKEQGQLKSPVAIAADNDKIYVVDAENHKVVVFNAAGRFLREMGLIGGEALVEPRQVAVDGEGNVYVLDVARGRIVVYDDQGVFVAGFGSLGKAKGFFDKPKAMTLGSDGRLYVAEQGRVQVFRVVLLPPAPTKLTATSGEGYVALKWEAAKTRFPAKYVIYRALPNMAALRLKETVETTITDDTLTPETTYSYSVAAQSVQGALSVPSAPALASALPSNNGPRLEIVTAQMDDIFSSHYKYYTRNPVARVVLRNNGLAPLEKIKVFLSVQGYMDFPAEVDLTELHYKSQSDVMLPATFNNRILEVSETTPAQAQIKVIFYQGGAENSVVRNIPFKLYSRNTLRWDKKERFAAFVTPNDPTLLEFARGVVLPFSEAHRGAPIPEPIRTAWALFEGLGTYGISYAPRPTNPYDRVSLDSSTVDTLQFGRETLARKSGDCADVVALMASSLESLTVASVALDAPGHLFLMFDTGESEKAALAFPEAMLVPYAGTYWIPIEVTSLGSPFLEAWKQGAEEYRRWSQQGKVSFIDIHQAWKTYQPATLPDTASGIKPPTHLAIEAKFLKDWQALVALRWQSGQAAAKEALAAKPGSGQPWLDLGFLAVEFKKYDEARQYFDKAKTDPACAAAAYNNLGNLAYIQNDLEKAETNYKAARQSDPKDAGISINLARLYLKQGMAEKASLAYHDAITLNPALKERYSDVSALAP